MLRNIIVALVGITCGIAVHADTHQKIRSTGSVTMGVREASGALSYSLGDKYVGFHVELCQRALADIQTHDIPDLW